MSRNFIPTKTIPLDQLTRAEKVLFDKLNGSEFEDIIYYLSPVERAKILSNPYGTINEKEKTRLLEVARKRKNKKPHILFDGQTYWNLDKDALRRFSTLFMKHKNVIEKKRIGTSGMSKNSPATILQEIDAIPKKLLTKIQVAMTKHNDDFQSHLDEVMKLEAKMKKQAKKKVSKAKSEVSEFNRVAAGVKGPDGLPLKYTNPEAWEM